MKTKKGRVSLWVVIFIIIVFLILGWLVTNNIYVFYKKDIIRPLYYKCDSGKIIKDQPFDDFFLISQSPKSSCESNCLSNYKHRSYFYCNEGNEIECVCEITVYNKYITPLF